ncbi:hypothetical protein KSP40_PGU017119 [Platanthera guangdongensis]|uniref:Uncharacterized protein n=1 Tax=Platanthera guangdongensis TaxID=2320717 RepID=A0ABR2MQ59_9ASPA
MKWRGSGSLIRSPITSPLHSRSVINRDSCAQLLAVPVATAWNNSNRCRCGLEQPESVSSPPGIA